MGTCYLHIGAPKTGSSAIQKFLLENNTLLSRAGYIYADYGISINNDGVGDGNAKNILKLIINNDLVGAAKYNKIIKKDLISNNVIISAEDLFNRAHINGFKILNEIFNNIRVKIILYIRNQAEIFESAIKQRIKNHFKSDYNIPQEYYQRFNWLICAQLWGKEFGKENIILRVYDKESFRRGSIVVDFLDSISAKIEIDEVSKSNKITNNSLDGAELELMRTLNSLKLEGNLHNEIKRKLSVYSRGYTSSRNFTWAFSSQQVVEVDDYFVQSNSKLKSEYGVKVPEYKSRKINSDKLAISAACNELLFKLISDQQEQIQSLIKG